jgi:hypothetical protein
MPRSIEYNKGERKMKLNFNGNGVNRLIKWGIPIVGLMVGGPIGCVVGLIIAACVSVSN